MIGTARKRNCRMNEGQKQYLVSGMVGGKTSYLGFDEASGGYPWASDRIDAVTTDLNEAHKWLKDAKKNLVALKGPRVFSFEINLVEVDMTSFALDDRLVQSILDELTPEQRNMLKDKLK
jgi:hypothetical protein